MKLASTRKKTLFSTEAPWKNSGRMCPLLSCDSSVVNNRDVRSTWPRPLTVLVKLLSSTLAVRRMRDRMPVARLWGWKMITQLCHKSAKSGGGNSTNTFTNKWGDRTQDYEKRLYRQVVLVWSKYHWLLSPESKRFECDDYNGNVSTGDFWKIYVRWGLHQWNYCFCLTLKNETLHVILFAVIVVQTASSYSFFHCCIRLQWDCNILYIDNCFDVLYEGKTMSHYFLLFLSNLGFDTITMSNTF